MREIKFRAWSEKDHRMRYEIDLSSHGKPMVLEGGWDYFGDDEDALVMQYTGLKDKNGKEIYEGDVIAYADINLGYVCFGECGINCNEYEGYGYFLSYSSEMFGVYASIYEVIGNIYENKDLISK